MPRFVSMQQILKLRFVLIPIIIFLLLSSRSNRKSFVTTTQRTTGISLVFNTTTMLCSTMTSGLHILQQYTPGNITTRLIGCVRPPSTDPTGCELCVPPNTTEVVIEVGTNINPEFGSYAKQNPHVFFITVEPIPEHYDTMTRNVLTGNRALDSSRFLAIPAVVAPGDSFTTLHIAKMSACSSVLPLTQVHWGKCAALRKTLQVPQITLDSIMNLIPPMLPISILSIDAQGFDLTVFSTLMSDGITPHRVRVVVMECQDLPHIVGEQRWLYRGSHSCSTIQKCLANSPRWGGFVFDACVNNHPNKDPYGELMGEYNCYFRRPDVPANVVDKIHKCSERPDVCRTQLVYPHKICPYL
eukprot:PhF_6_TR5179/c0_g1_i1/m.7440